MKTRFKVGDIIAYFTDDRSFEWGNGKYEIINTDIRKFSDTGEEFQDLECVPLNNKDRTSCHFMDGAIYRNPYISLAD